MTPTHGITFSERNRSIIDKGRALIEQKVLRRDHAMVAYTESIAALKEAQESGDAEQIRLASHVVTVKTEGLRHDELMLDAAFLELFGECIEAARQAVTDEAA